MKIIGLTGGIGSGKSTVSKLFEVFGIPVYIADTESKRLTNTSLFIREKLIAKFGNSLFVDNQLDKSLLATLIFKNEDNLRFVNSIIHPEVYKDFLSWQEKKKDIKLVAIESAILFESGFDSFVDFKVAISSPLEVRIQRIEERDGLSREAILARMNNQLTEDKRNAMSDYIIFNDDKHALISQVENMIHTLNS